MFHSTILLFIYVHPYVNTYTHYLSRRHNVTVFKGRHFGMTGTPTVGHLNCSGIEDDLYNCRNSKWTTESSCDDQNIAAIICR